MSGRGEALTDPATCEHRVIDTWAFTDADHDSGDVAGWACRSCRRKFAPKDQATVSPPTKHPEALSPESETLLRSWDLGDDPVTAEWLRPRLAAIEAAAAREALDLLAVFVERTPCRFDHHGGCQEHGFLEPEDPWSPCPMAEGRALLGWDEPEPTYDRRRPACGGEG